MEVEKFSDDKLIRDPEKMQPLDIEKKQKQNRFERRSSFSDFVYIRERHQNDRRYLRVVNQNYKTLPKVPDRKQTHAGNAERNDMGREPKKVN